MSVDRFASGVAAGGAWDGLAEPFGGRSNREPVLTGWRPFWLCVSLAGCAIAGVFLAQGGGQASADNPGSAHFSPIAFVENERLAPMFSFDPPEGVRGRSRYQARVREGDGERIDTFTYGDVGADEMFFCVSLRRRPSALARSSLFVELARQSAEFGAAILRATSPQPFATERGRVEWADVRLSGRQGERSCLGFRLTGGEEADLSGLACGGQGSALDPQALECLIHRLSPTEAGIKAGLGEVLDGDPTRPTACRRVAS